MQRASAIRRQQGRMGRQTASGHNRRARAEAAIARRGQATGDAPHSRRDERRDAKVEAAVHALNRMLGLERPVRVRIA